MYKNLNLDFEYKATTHQYIATLTNMPKNVYQLKKIKEKSIGKEKETRQCTREPDGASDRTEWIRNRFPLTPSKSRLVQFARNTERKTNFRLKLNVPYLGHQRA